MGELHLTPFPGPLLSVVDHTTAYGLTPDLWGHSPGVGEPRRTSSELGHGCVEAGVNCRGVSQLLSAQGFHMLGPGLYQFL